MTIIRRYTGLGLFAAAAVLAMVVLSGDRYLAFVAGITLIYILWATGMNLLYGYAGLMPMMFAGVAGVSAYATINLTMAWGWSFFVAAPVATLAAAAFGTALGLPALRLRGFYFTLCSLVIQTVITLGFVYFAGFTNGDTGISQIPAPTIAGQPVTGLAYDLVLVAVAVVGIGALIAIVHAPLGRRLIAIREDEELTQALGTDITFYKLLVFFIGGLYAGIGGALYAPYVGFVSPRSFDVLISLNIWLMVAFGSRGMIWGPVLGAALLAPLPYLLQDYYMLKEALYGALIIAVIVALPGGLLRGLAGLVRSRGTKPSATAAPPQATVAARTKLERSR